MSTEGKDTQNPNQGLVKKQLVHLHRRPGLRLFVQTGPECTGFSMEMPVGLGVGADS